MQDPRPATSSDNVAISVTETGDRRIVDLKQKSLLRVLVPLAASMFLLGVALIVMRHYAGTFAGRPEMAIIGIPALWAPFAAYHFVVTQFLDRERLTLTADGVLLTLGLGVRLRRVEAPWCDVSVEISRPADVREHRDIASFSPWKRAWMGGVLITLGDESHRVGGWLFDEDAAELRELIEGMRPPRRSQDPGRHGEGPDLPCAS